LILGYSGGAGASITTQDTDEDLTIQPNGAGNLIITTDTINVSGEAVDVEIIDATANAFRISQSSNDYFAITTSDGAPVVTLDTYENTGTMNFGTQNFTRTINIGTGTAADTINIGTGGTTADIISIGTGLESSKVIFFERTAAPNTFTTNGQFAIGSITSNNTSGRIWVRANNRNYRFQSAANTADYSEYLQQKETSEPGDVMVLSKTDYETVEKSRVSYDQNVLGVVTQYGTNNNAGDCWDEVSCNRQTDPKWANVGMLGQVYTKVSVENGNISPGDPLTTSNATGIAMKASKTSRILGYALDYFDGSTSGKDLWSLPTASTWEVDVPSSDTGPARKVKAGKILILLQANWYEPDVPPAEITDITFVNPQGDLESKAVFGLFNNTTGKEISSTLVKKDAAIANLQAGFVDVQMLESQNATLKGATTIERLQLGEITAIADLTVSLSKENGQFILTGAQDSPVFTIDSLGNVNLTGTLTADKIKANQIEGIELITDKISYLSDKIAGIATESGQRTVNSQQITDNKIIELGNISFGAGIANLDMTVLGTLQAKGALIVEKESTFKSETFFEKLVNFMSDVVFKGRATFNKDTAGFAVIKKGQRQVKIVFDKEYKDLPVVTINNIWEIENDTLSVADDLDGFFAPSVKYVIAGLSRKSFTIILDEPAVSDTRFSWIAMSISGATTFESDKDSDLVTPVPDISDYFTPTPTIQPSATSSQPSVTITPSSDSRQPTTDNINPSPSSTDIAKTVIVVPNDLGFIRMRQEPNLNSVEISQIPIGTTLTYQQIQYDWYLVTWQGKTGWVSGSFVSK
jgi:hypothetical protein